MIFRCGVYTGMVGPRAGPRCGGPGGGPRERLESGRLDRAGAHPGVGPPAPLAGRERRRAVLGVGAAHGQGAPRAEHLERDELAMLEALEVLARHAAAEELRVSPASPVRGGGGAAASRPAWRARRREASLG